MKSTYIRTKIYEIIHGDMIINLEVRRLNTVVHLYYYAMYNQSKDTRKKNLNVLILESNAPSNRIVKIEIALS